MTRTPLHRRWRLVVGLGLGLAILLWQASGLAGAAVVPPLDAHNKPLPPSWLVWLTSVQKVQRKGLDRIALDRKRWVPTAYGATLAHGPGARREVALTFDDGPHPTYTPQLLALLKRYNAHATFFVVGQQARLYPDLVRQEVAAGHCVGNHTYHHVNLQATAQPDLSAEILACGDVLQSITGQRPHLFRPPGGRYDRGVLTLAHALGYTTVLWTDNSHDYLNPNPVELKDRVFGGVGNGEIILLHDGVKENLAILGSLLEYLKATGRQCVTVDEMLRQGRPAQPVVARRSTPSVNRRPALPARPAPATKPAPQSKRTVAAAN